MIMCLEKDKLNPYGRQKLTNIKPYLLTYLLTYLHHGAESFLRS